MPKGYKKPKLNLGYLKKAEKAAKGSGESKEIYGKDKNLFKQISKRYLSKIKLKPKKKSRLERERAKTDDMARGYIEKERIKREKKIKLRIKGMK